MTKQPTHRCIRCGNPEYVSPKFRLTPLCHKCGKLLVPKEQYEDKKLPTAP